jgi:hypothetical protein
MGDMAIDWLLRDVDREIADRAVWDAHWSEVAELTIPAYRDHFLSGGFINPGEKKTEKQIDSTAPSALMRFASVMESVVTPRGQTWHNLRPTNHWLKRDRQVALWFEQVNDIIFRYRYAPDANFATVQSEGYVSLGAFGTKCKFIDKPSKGVGLRYKTIPLNEIQIKENHQGVVDTVYRSFKLKGRQIMQQFGKAVDPQVFREYEAGQDKDWDVVHVVRPNNDRDPRVLTAKGKKFESLYLCKKTKKILQHGGYDMIPYIVSRYTTIPGEKYGRSPAMSVLPAIKLLNEQKRTVLLQGQKSVNPVIFMHDDGVLDGANIAPGAFNMGGVSADGRLLVHALPTGNLAVGRDMMEDERMTINDAFLITLFQILIETPTMTATEVLERAREKAALLAPIAGRQESEDLSPSVDREIDLLIQQGLLPPMPPALQDVQIGYEIDFDSPMSRMQKAESAAGTLRWIQMGAELAAQTQNPAAMDAINIDATMAYLAEAQGVRVSCINDMVAIDEMRQGRQQQQATQQMIDAAPSMASMLKAAQP